MSGHKKPYDMNVFKFFNQDRAQLIVDKIMKKNYDDIDDPDWPAVLEAVQQITADGSEIELKMRPITGPDGSNGLELELLPVDSDKDWGNFDN